MKLTHLRIHRYRDVAPGTSLVFGPALNLVLGDNGTGRTTLLELLARVLAADFSSLLHEEFSLEYALDFPDVDVHIQVRNERPAIEPAPESAQALARPVPDATEAPLAPFMQITLALHAPATRLVLRANAEGVAWEVEGQPDYAQKMYWSLLDRTVWVVLFLAAQRLAPEHKERLKELLRRTFLLAPARFDEALGGFERIGQSQYAMETRGEEVFPLGLMSLPTWLPGLLRERAPRAAATGFIDVRHDELERTFLARFVALAGLSAGRFRVELLDKRSWEDGGRLEFGRFGFTFTRRDGTLLLGEHLGHGQKRLLSLLYYLDVNEDFVLADELANGLHPRWVEAVVRELHGRQSFVTSQNPLLFDYVTLPDAEAPRASLIHCALAEREGRECKAWSNADPDVSARLFGDYARGGTPLATLLRLHGLW
jgi:energy-coupling factor transporter ATP-binding protein EcfA2